MPGQSHWGFKDSRIKDRALVKAWSNAFTCKQRLTLPVTADFRSVFLALFLILTRSSEPVLPEQMRQGLADLSCTFRLKCIRCIWELHDYLQQIHFYLKSSKECFWVDSALSITSEPWSEMCFSQLFAPQDSILHSLSDVILWTFTTHPDCQKETCIFEKCNA